MKLQQEIDEYIKTIQPVCQNKLQASRKRWLKLSNGTGAPAGYRETGRGLRRLWQDLQDELILSRNTS